MPFHFRYTPNDLKYDMTGYANTCGGVHIIAREFTQPGNKEHYHIYIDTDDCKDTVVNHARKWLNIPKGKQGKANAYFMCKEWDNNIEYFCKGNLPPRAKGHDIISYAGFTLEQINAAHESGYQRYLVPIIESDKATQNARQAAAEGRPTDVKKYKLTEWEYLLDESTFLKENVCYTPGKTARQWKTWICQKYISRQRCVPRTGDLTRYAYSLYMIHNSNGGLDSNQVLALTEDYVHQLEKNLNE